MHSQRLSLPAKLSALILLATLTGCATTTGSSVPTDVSCKAFGPIYWSAKDTDRTIAQVREHNASGKALCGWGKK